MFLHKLFGTPTTAEIDDAELEYLADNVDKELEDISVKLSDLQK